ncbi:MAG: two-component regulator propeller domain-containing protein [Acidobacteriota bacterium]
MRFLEHPLWTTLVLCWLLVQSGALGAEGPPRFEHLTNQDGLSQMNVMSILQDGRGFLWFGTDSGLDRFDGHEFRRIQLPVPGSVRALLEGAGGELWLGTAGGGLQRFDPRTETFEVHRHDPAAPGGLPDDRVSALYGDGELLWVGTAAGLVRFDPASAAFETHRHDPADGGSLPNDEVRAIVGGSSGELWVGTAGGLCRFDPEAGRCRTYRHDPTDPESLARDRVRALHLDPSNALWVGTKGGLDRLDPQTGRVTRYRHDPSDPRSLPRGTVWRIRDAKAGRLWVGLLSGGLALFDPSNGSFESFRHDPSDPYSLGHDAVVSLYVDRSDILWVGTAPGGVHYFDPGAGHFELHRRDPEDGTSLSANLVKGFSEDPRGRLWVGTWGGLDRYEPETGRFVHLRHDPEDPGTLSSNAVNAMACDGGGRLWIAYLLGGLDALDTETGEVVRHQHDPAAPDSLGPGGIHSLALMGDHLWIGMWRAGLSRLDPATGRFEHFGAADGEMGPGSDRVLALEPAGSGRLWVGTAGGGISLRSPDGSFARHVHDPGNPHSLASDSVRSLLLDRGGRLWIGTDGAGLDLLEDPERGTFRHFPATGGLSNGVIQGIEQDAHGRLWLSTNGGLHRFDPATERWVRYDVLDGLQDMEFNVGSSYRGGDGRLYFGGIRGYNSFAPEDFLDSGPPPPVALTSVDVMNRGEPLESAPYLENLELSHGERQFSFELAALSFLRADKNRYAYRLEGFDGGWIDAGSRRYGSYTNVPSGSFTLWAKAANAEGLWGTETPLLSVTVRPAPWRTAWAYAAYLLTAFGVAVAFVTAQQRKVRRAQAITDRLREVDRLKDEFLANTSHELRTPLYGITGMAESLLDGSKDDLPASARHDLELIVASGRRLGSLVNDILDFSKLRRGGLNLAFRPVDVHSVVEVVLVVSRPLAAGKRLELHNLVPADLPPVWADEDRLVQMLHNLVGNAVKFTDEGRVEVSARRVRGWRPQGDSGTSDPTGPRFGTDRLVLTVTDTGIGISGEHQRRIFEPFEQADSTSQRVYGGTGLGLAVTQQLVGLHGGRLWVDSVLGEGSTFSLELPTSPADPKSTPAPAPVSVLASKPAPAPTPVPGAAPGPLSEAVDPPEPPKAWANRPPKILVVDDEPINRSVLANQLTAAGYRPVLASGGSEALSLVDDEGPFDLVLLDLMMPKMSGYEVCRQLRRRFGLEDLPVLFLTAKDRVEDRVEGLSEGVNDFLTKPIARDELLARVRVHLELRAAHQRRLGELLPLCASCHKIRDDEGYWSQLETYLAEQAGISVSHGLCPDCVGKVMAELEDGAADIGDRLS